MTGDEETRATVLMRAAQGGEEQAYAELLILLAGVASRYARKRLGDVPWIDDVVQETLVTVHKSRHTYDPSRPFVPWFYAILGTRLIDVLRRERRVATREFGTTTLAETSDPHVDGPWRAGERSTLDPERIRAAVEALPRKQRDVVDALKYQDETVRAAAERLGMSEAAVKITAHRGYKALRRLLGGRTREN